MKAYKVFTHNLCSPIQGGKPVWDGTLPYQLPTVPLDTGEEECAAGWNACRRPGLAIEVAGLWPDGWPSRIFEIEAPDESVLERGQKLRAATWCVQRELPIIEGIEEFSAKYFKVLAPQMIEQQLAWHTALGRPQVDRDTVKSGLQAALKIRGLSWALKEFGDAWDARAAWAARDAWDARAAWAAWAARDAWDARAARDAWSARAAWDARDAWSARAALTVFYSVSVCGRKADPLLLTTGLREAYKSGLAIALPTGPDELGWAMVPKQQEQAKQEAAK
mgnify:CR=1 FL=1